MARKLEHDVQDEQRIAKAERQELKQELAEQASNRPPRPRNRRRMITMIVLAVVIVLAALFSVLTLLPSATSSPGGVPVGTAAPEFVLLTYGGGGSGMIDLHALRGHPVLLNFWSESCPPCRVEMPFLQRTYTQYAAHGEFTLLGINQADPKEDIAPFGKAFRITYPLLFDPGDKVNVSYGVTAIPTTYFIDSAGIVRSAFVTQLSPKTMRQGLASVGIVIP
jgi:cytochrome c biogenesis protein CcmG/thiol:disulfide interchange protein DsbE